VTLGRAERQGRLGNVAAARCEQDLPQRSVYRLLHAERDRLFGDELFADLYVHCPASGFLRQGRLGL